LFGVFGAGDCVGRLRSVLRPFCRRLGQGVHRQFRYHHYRPDRILAASPWQLWGKSAYHGPGQPAHRACGL